VLAQPPRRFFSLFAKETADEDESRSPVSSQTESLLLHNPHSYPPEPPTESDNEKRLSPPPSHSHSITIPTREAVFLARSRPTPRKPHTKLVLIGIIGLFSFAYVSTQLLALGTRFGGQPKVQVILMISDGMGKLSSSLSLSFDDCKGSELNWDEGSVIGPASETFARSYLGWLHGSNGTVVGRSRLNESYWAGLEKEFDKGGSGTGSPLDSILVGSSRVRSTYSLYLKHSLETDRLDSCIIQTRSTNSLITGKSSLSLPLPSVLYSFLFLSQIQQPVQQPSHVSSRLTTERSVSLPKRPLVVPY